MPANMLIPGPSASSIRRKPQFTYRSPSANQSDSSTIMLQRLGASSSSIQKGRHSTSSHSPEQAKPGIAQTTTPPTITTKRKRYPMNPPLPLYHPLGPLALSLPPLDAAAYGLPPIPKSLLNDSSHSCKSMGNGRDGEEERLSPAASGSPLVIPAPAVARESSKDKPNSRRRRAGGGGQRRKRKEPDDSDAPYPNPPKRTRHPRGGAKDARASSAVAVDLGSPTESNGGFGMGGDVTPTLEPKAELPEDTATERRGTRGSNLAKRNNESSNPSEAATPTGSDTARDTLTEEATIVEEVVTAMAVGDAPSKCDEEVARIEALEQVLKDGADG